MDEHQVIYFPEPEEIGPLAIAFAQMMFAYAAFENEVRQLQTVITGVEGFGEQRRNQWNARARPDRMIKLIADHRGAIPQARSIKTILTDAIPVCDDRNLLTHGEWWCFERDTSTIHVRGGTRWGDEPFLENKAWIVADVVAITEKFKDLEAELFKLRRAIEQRTPSSDSAAHAP